MQFPFKLSYIYQIRFYQLVLFKLQCSQNFIDRFCLKNVINLMRLLEVILVRGNNWLGEGKIMSTVHRGACLMLK